MSCIRGILYSCLPTSNYNDDENSRVNKSAYFFNCMFCKGKNCKYEQTPTDDSQFYPGINISQYSDLIYASNRPTQINIEKYKTETVLKNMGITLIVNLQLEGEHPNCGPQKLLKNGFTYLPSSFESNHIEVDSVNWVDLKKKTAFDFILRLLHTIYPKIVGKQKANP